MGKSSRPSPSVSATLFAVGSKMKGGDGNTWEVKKAANGVQRWSKAKVAVMKTSGGVMKVAMKKKKAVIKASP